MKKFFPPQKCFYPHIFHIRQKYQFYRKSNFHLRVVKKRGKKLFHQTIWIVIFPTPRRTYLYDVYLFLKSVLKFTWKLCHFWKTGSTFLCYFIKGFSYCMFHFWKTVQDFQNFQTSNQFLKIIRPRRDTCDTALESWRSIFFDEKVFYPYFPYTSKISVFQKIENFICGLWKRGGKKLLEEIKNFFQKIWIVSFPTPCRTYVYDV